MTDTFTPSTASNTTARHLADVQDAFWSAAGDDQEFGAISFDRCVDWLLDLHQSCTDPEVRTLVSDVLDDLRELGPFGPDLEDLVLGALASVETAMAVWDEYGSR